MSTPENKPAGPKTRRRTSAYVAFTRVVTELRELLAAWCEAHGGQLSEVRYFTGGTRVEGAVWVIPTKYGLWRVTEPSDPYPNAQFPSVWIFTRFMEPKRAATGGGLTGLNRHSGKWNYTAGDASAAYLFTAFTAAARNLFDYRCEICAQLKPVDSVGLVVQHDAANPILDEFEFCAGSGQVPADTCFPSDVTPPCVCVAGVRA